MPAPALAAAAIRGMQAARAAAGALQEERSLARRAKAASQALRAKSEIKSKLESAERLAKRLKQLKRIGWLIKGVTLGTTSFGDIFISVWVLLFWANVELVLFPIFIPWWKQEWWEKAFTIMLDLVVFSILLLVIGVLALILKAAGVGLDMFEMTAPFGLGGLLRLIREISL